jgi:hypothetical protein
VVALVAVALVIREVNLEVLELQGKVLQGVQAQNLHLTMVQVAVVVLVQ